MRKVLIVMSLLFLIVILNGCGYTESMSIDELKTWFNDNYDNHNYHFKYEKFYTVGRYGDGYLLYSQAENSDYSDPELMYQLYIQPSFLLRP